MGKGADAGTPQLRRSRSFLEKLQGFKPKETFAAVKQDVVVLKNIWFTSASDGRAELIPAASTALPHVPPPAQSDNA